MFKQKFMQYVSNLSLYMIKKIKNEFKYVVIQFS